MQKKILSSLLLASALPFNVHALGLGDIEVYSALNQPLDAEIEITAAKPGEADSLLVKLASEQAFLKSGVERPFMLTKLKFKASYKADGTPIIKITSPKSVREPFLNFLVDVEWPRGRLVREYTILLDPPSFSTRQPVTTASPEVTKAAAAGSAPIEREPEPAPAPDTGVYGFAEPEPVTQAQAEVEQAVEAAPEPAPVEEVVTYQEPVEEAVDVTEQQQAELVEETLGFDEPLPNEIETVDVAEETLESQAPVEEVAEEASPFSDLLNDIQGEESVEFDENAFAPTAEPAVEAVADVAPVETLDADTLPLGDDLPEINLSLDETIPFNAESILASDNDYVDPEIEALLRGDAVPLYREPTPEPEPEVVFVEPEPVVEERPDTYTVEEGDIMLRIAEQFRPEEVDINQAMLAIMRYNPEAFIQENVNLVRKGQVLRIPDEEAMLALSQGDALAEVQGQNALWREYRAQLAGAQSISTETADTSSADAADYSAPTTAEAESTTQLALVAPGKDDESTDFASGEQEGDGEVRRLERNLALAKEKLVASNLEQTELQSRINELEQIVTQSEGIINLKSQQLAQLQANAETTNEAAEQVEEAVEDVMASDAVTESADDDLLAGIDGVEEVAEVESTEDAATETTDTTVASAPIAVTEPASARPEGLGGIIYDVIPPSLRPTLKPILEGSLLYVILAAIVLLPIIIWFLLSRKSKQEPEIVFEEELVAMGGDEAAAEDDVEATMAGADAEATMSMDAIADDMDTEATMVSTVAQTAVMEPEAAPAEEAADDDIQDDTTAEVDVYIAYGLHDQAEELLKQAISDNPDVTAYRGKLLETYYNAGKKDEFINEAQGLHDHLAGQPSKVWDKAVVLGKEIAPDNMLFSDAEVSGDLKASDFAAAKPDMADIDLGAGEEEGLDIDLGGDDIDLSAADLGSDEADLSSGEEESVEEDEFSLDDVAAELDASMDDDAGEEEVAADDGELEFDVADFIDEGGESAEVEESLEIDAGDLDLDDAAADVEESMDLDVSLDDDSADIDLSDAADVDLGMDDADLDLSDSADIDLDMGDDLDLGETEEESASEPESDGMDLDLGDDLGMDLDADNLFEEDAAAEPEAAVDDGLDLDMDISEESSDDGLDFDMADVDVAASEDDQASDDTMGLDDGLFDDDADSTQMIDDESLETMIDDIESDSADFGLDDDMPDNLDEVGTKLDLAKAYIDMGDSDGAKASLEEVIQEGNAQQKKEAEELLGQI